MVNEVTHTMLFGKFKGMHVLEVDDNYLRWSINNVKMNDRQRYIVSCYLNGTTPNPNYGRKKQKSTENVGNEENEGYLKPYKDLPFVDLSEAF
jgi:hypothetical protein